MAKIQIEINAELILTLESLNDWVRKCPDYLPQKRYYKEDFLFIDSLGNKMVMGADFKAAQKLNSYPVKVYRFTTADEFLNH